MEEWISARFGCVAVGKKEALFISQGYVKQTFIISPVCFARPSGSDLPRWLSLARHASSIYGRIFPDDPFSSSSSRGTRPRHHIWAVTQVRRVKRSGGRSRTMRGGYMLRTGQCLLAEAVGCMEVGGGLMRAGINKKQKRKRGKLRQCQSAVLAISLVLSHLSLGARKPEHAYVPHPPRPAVPLNVQMQHKRNRPLSSHLLHEFFGPLSALGFGAIEVGQLHEHINLCYEKPRLQASSPGRHSVHLAIIFRLFITLFMSTILGCSLPFLTQHNSSDSWYLVIYVSGFLTLWITVLSARDWDMINESDGQVLGSQKKSPEGFQVPEITAIVTSKAL
ncbi:hypothetical protein C8J57DRAFT_1248857 [Mycena rebaudengoi]|nr:hypothetical protein C8J57DRAFT_1248857 [Mycena rebaudengoi]